MYLILVVIYTARYQTRMAFTLAPTLSAAIRAVSPGNCGWVISEHMPGELFSFLPAEADASHFRGVRVSDKSVHAVGIGLDISVPAWPCLCAIYLHASACMLGCFAC